MTNQECCGGYSLAKFFFFCSITKKNIASISGRASATETIDLDSIPGRAEPKTKKIGTNRQCCRVGVERRILPELLLLFYRAASEGWMPPMSKEDTRESSLTQKCYWQI